METTEVNPLHYVWIILSVIFICVIVTVAGCFISYKVGVGKGRILQAESCKPVQIKGGQNTINENVCERHDKAGISVFPLCVGWGCR